MGGGNLSVQNSKMVYAGLPRDYNATAMPARYISMKYYGHVQICIVTGAWAAGTPAVSLLQSVDVAASSTAALGFTSYWTDAAATGVMVETAVVANTFNIANQANVQYMIEVDSRSLSAGYDCLTLVIATPGANADLYCAWYNLTMPRYTSATPPNPLVD
jgi:hypothetical protein